MSNDQNEQPSAEELEQEVRRGRKFSSREALARLAGPGAMKGASPVSPAKQAELDIGSWIRSHVADPVGALQAVLHRQAKACELLLNHLDKPLVGLAEYFKRVLGSDYLLKELVREADVEWAQRMDERPYFEREGAPPHPGDPYTAESVRETLGKALKQLTEAG